MLIALFESEQNKVQSKLNKVVPYFILLCCISRIDFWKGNGYINTFSVIHEPFTIPDKELDRNNLFRSRIYSISFDTVETVLYCIAKKGV